MSLRANPFTALVTAATLVLGALVVVVALAGPASAQGTVTVQIAGQGSVTGDGISCTQSGGDCSQFYGDEEDCVGDPPHETCFDVPPEVTLTAGADSNGFVFDHFTGCDSTSGRTCTVTVDSSTNVTAVFRDAQAPSVSLASPSNASKVRGLVSISATASDNASVTKVEFYDGATKLGEDASAPYELSWNTSAASDGPHTVSAKAFDSAGNLTSSAGNNVTVDNHAPSLSVTGPDGQTFGPGTTQSWTFVVMEPTTGPPTVQCSLVAAGAPASFGACTAGSAGHSVSNQPGGSYDLRVRAIDGAGNVSEALRSFTIDATPPDTALTSGPNPGAVVTARSVAFGFSATEGGSTFQCRVYPAGTTAPAFAPCSGASSHTASGLADGGYRFEVRGVDAVGNADASPAARDFTVDATAPQATFTTQPPKKVKTTKKKAKVTFAFAAEPGATFRCSLDGAAFTACPSSVTYKLKAGEHSFQVVAVDAAGNVQAVPATSGFKVKRVKKKH